MLQIEEILFPVDFSERCCAAARHAAEMASHFQAKLTLLHVIALPTSWYGELPPVEYSDLWDLESVRKQRRITLDSFLTGELSAVREVERIVEQGDPATVIADYAESRKPDLIVLPTHGHGPVRRLLLGSVTAKVLHDVRLPVWTDVHEAGSFARSGCKSVLCAVDPAEEALPTVRWAAGFADRYGAELILAHAIPAFDPGLPIPDDAIFHKYLADTSRERVAQLQQRAGVTAKISI